MMTRQRTLLLVSGFALALVLLALCSGAGLPGNWTVVAGGQPVTGFAGLGYAVGGLLAGLAIAFFALLFVGFILTGVSLLVMVLFAVILSGMLVLFSPLLVPLLMVGGLMMLFSRKKKVAVYPAV